MATSNHSSVPEGFKEIPGYDGRYFIDRAAQVWSVAKNRLMSPQADTTHPYPWVLLTKPDKKKQPDERSATTPTPVVPGQRARVLPRPRHPPFS